MFYRNLSEHPTVFGDNGKIETNISECIENIDLCT